MRQPWFASTISSSVAADRVAHGLDDRDVVAPVGVVEADLDRAHAARRAAPPRGARAPPARPARRSTRTPAAARSARRAAARAACPSARADEVPARATSAIHGRAAVEVDGLARARARPRCGAGRGPTQQAARAAPRRAGRRRRSRSRCEPVVGRDDDERRLLARARHGIPRRAERRVERRRVAARLDGRDAHALLARRSTRWARPRARSASARDRLGATTGASASRDRAARMASRLACAHARSRRSRPGRPRRRRAGPGRRRRSAAQHAVGERVEHALARCRAARRPR